MLCSLPSEILSLPPRDQQLRDVTHIVKAFAISVSQWLLPTNIIEAPGKLSPPDMPQMRFRSIRIELRPLLQAKPGQQHFLKDQAQHSLRVPRRDLVCSRSAPVFAAHVELLVAEMGHQLSEVVCYGGHIVATVGMGRVPDAAHVCGYHCVLWCQEWQHFSPVVARLWDL